MKKLKNFFRNIEEVRLGGRDIYIEHSGLENLLGCASIIVVGVVTSPIWIPTLIYYGISSAGKYGYNKLKGNNKGYVKWEI